MSDDLRTLLTQVAAGDVSPDEAAVRLHDLDLDPAEPGAPDRTGPAGRLRAVERVQIRAEGVRLTVLADPFVAEAVAEGPHRITREGAVLRLDAGAAAAEGYEVDSQPGLPRWLSWIRQDPRGGVRVTVRVNPRLAVELDTIGSLVEVRGLRAGLTAQVSGAKLIGLDLDCPFDIRATFTHVILKARVAAGESSVSSEFSKVDIRLQPGSDVRVSAEAELGDAVITGDDTPTTRGDDGMHAVARTVVGDGTATLTVTARLGKAEVRLP